MLKRIAISIRKKLSIFEIFRTGHWDYFNAPSSEEVKIIKEEKKPNN